jgi:hypothetical protein
MCYPEVEEQKAEARQTNMHADVTTHLLLQVSKPVCPHHPNPTWVTWACVPLIIHKVT